MRRSLGWLSLFLLALLLGVWLPQHGKAVMAPQGAADCNIFWNEVLHDTFDSNYRSIVGPTTPNTTVKLRLRVAQSDITSARVRVWNDRTNTETYVNMAWDGAFDTDPVVYDWWVADIPAGADPTILYYFFEINDNGFGACSPADQDFYTDDDPKFYGGGYGAMSDNYNDQKSFQITVYNPAFNVPAWMQKGVVYQIFPDRFRDGNPANDPTAGRFFYGANSAIVRSNNAAWNSTMCDPRNVVSPTCSQHYSDNFYGGDLAGITEKINAGYFDNLGVSVLYLNPIFKSPSNHKYDTADYLQIDPDFGTLADFQALAAAANAHGLKLILDGVFNHTSSDSPYFDYYTRYADSGACESAGSPYASWFYIPDIGTPACEPDRTGDPNVCDAADRVTCRPPGYGGANTYEAWYGYGSLPKLQANSAPVRALIWSNGLNSVGPYWTNQGASGWRFDVGGDVDCGLTCAPANDYWEGFRTAVRNVNPQTVTLGEEWGDASAWLLGSEWDSVMNYRFRSAMLSWLFTGCSGNGCTGGTTFEDNDSNAGSSSGAISAITPSQFNARLRSIQEDYPPMAFKAMMNLPGSHDTNRVRFLLKKSNNDNDTAAVQRMKEWWLFAFTYPGAPTLYYGDEIGLSHDGVFASGKYEDDPYNRAPFPWPDASGTSYSYDSNAQAADLAGFSRQMASIRWSYPALQDGDVQHGLIINDANKVYGFARTNGSQTALIALNRDNASHPATFTGLNAAPYNLLNGASLVDALSGATTVVTGGAVTVTVPSNWGVVLLEATKVQTPVAAPGLAAVRASNSVTLTWSTVMTDTTGGRELATVYDVHRSLTPGFTPGPATLQGSVKPSDASFRFGATAGQFSFNQTVPTGSTYYYQVCARNAPGASAACPEVTASTPQQASLQASVALQGRPTPPNPRWIVPLTVTLTIPGQGAPAYSFAPTTDASGIFTLTGILPGTYDMRVKHSHTLQNRQTLTLAAGANPPAAVGTLLEGDANNDNYVTLVDFSILVNTFGKCIGFIGYDARADFNGDGCVTLLDFSLLATNFGAAGQTKAAAAPAVKPPARSVNLVLEPASAPAADGSLTVAVVAQAGAQPVDGVAVYLDFDPAQWRVAEVTPGVALPLTLQSSVDQKAGAVNLALGALGNFPSGAFTVATLRLLPVNDLATPATPLLFHHDAARRTDVTFGGFSVWRSPTLARE